MWEGRFNIHNPTGTMTEILICPVCGTEYYDRTGSQTSCPGKQCRKSNAESMKKTRTWEGANKRKERINKENAKEYKVTGVIKHAIIVDMVRDYGYAYCQICGPGESGIPLELHHIAYRSEVPNHPKKHSRINTVLLCR